MHSLQCLPQDNLLQIFLHLHWLDLCAVECVCRRFYFLVRKNVWPNVRQLRCGSGVFAEDGGPSADGRRPNLVAWKCRAPLTNKILHHIATRCTGKQLRDVKLSWPTLSQLSPNSHPNEWFVKSDSENVKVTSFGLCQIFPVTGAFDQLYTLDISHVPIRDGRLLPAIGRHCGATLRALILKNCFKQSCPMVPGQSDWEQLCRFCVRLRHLDISECYSNAVRQLSFAHIPATLEQFDAFDTRLSGESLVQLGQMCGHGLRRLAFGVYPQVPITNAQCNALFESTKRLTQLRVEKFIWEGHILAADGNGVVLRPQNLCQLEHLAITSMIHPDQEDQIPHQPAHNSDTTFLKFLNVLAPMAAHQHLRCLELDCSDLDAHHFARIGALSRTLCTLRFSRCVYLDDPVLCRLAESCLQMEELSIIQCPRVSDQTFVHYVRQNNKLRRIEAGEQLTDKVFEHLEQRLNERHGSTLPGGGGGGGGPDNDNGPEGIFWFVRNFQHLCYPDVFGLLQIEAPNQVQSTTMNMHPWICFDRSFLNPFPTCKP